MKLPIQIAILALIVAFIFDALFFEAYLVGINLIIAEVVFLAAAFFLAFRSKRKLPPRVYIAAAFAIFYAGSYAIWTSELALSLNIFGFVVANALFGAFILGYFSDYRHPLSYLGVIGRTVGHLFERIDFFSHLKPKGISQRNLSILKGIAIAVPLLILFAALFASADLVFEEYTSNIFDWFEDWMDIENAITRTFYIAFFALLTALLFAGAFWKRFEIKAPIVKHAKGVIESAVVLTLVNALFAVFLVIQGVYLFGGEEYLRQMDLTFSDYAVQGFNELMAVVAVVYIVVLSLRYFHREKTKKLLLALHALLLGQTALVLVSSLTRLNLYVDAYGFTPARIFAYVYIATATIILLLTLINTLLESSQGKLVRYSILIFGLSIVAFTVITPDALSLQLNAQRAYDKQPIRMHDVRKLSEEAYPVFLNAINDGVPMEGRFSYRYNILAHCNGYAQSSEKSYVKPLDWRSWNYSRTRFCDILPILPESGTEFGVKE